jgi:hypothetical protein
VEEMMDFDTSQYEQFWKPDKPGPKKGAFTKKRLKTSGCLYLRNPQNDDSPLPSPFYWLVSIHSHDVHSPCINEPGAKVLNNHSLDRPWQPLTHHGLSGGHVKSLRPKRGYRKSNWFLLGGSN